MEMPSTPAATTLLGASAPKTTVRSSPMKASGASGVGVAKLPLQAMLLADTTQLPANAEPAAPIAARVTPASRAARMARQLSRRRGGDDKCL
jgi:hypothetical protein